MVAFDSLYTFWPFESRKRLFAPGVTILFIFLGRLEEFRVCFKKPNPLNFLLVKAKEASATASGVSAFLDYTIDFNFVFERQLVRRNSDPRRLKNFIHVVDADDFFGIE